MPVALTDVIDALAGIKPGSALDAVRNRRPQAREQAEASFRALFEPESFAGVSATERFGLAVFVTGLHGDTASAAFYAERLAATGPSGGIGCDRCRDRCRHRPRPLWLLPCRAAEPRRHARPKLRCRARSA